MNQCKGCGRFFAWRNLIAHSDPEGAGGARAWWYLCVRCAKREYPERYKAQKEGGGMTEQGWMKREINHVRRIQRLHDNVSEMFDILVTLVREGEHPSDDGGAFDTALEDAKKMIRQIES